MNENIIEKMINFFSSLFTSLSYIIPFSVGIIFLFFFLLFVLGYFISIIINKDVKQYLLINERILSINICANFFSYLIIIMILPTEMPNQNKILFITICIVMHVLLKFVLKRKGLLFLLISSDWLILFFICIFYSKDIYKFFSFVLFISLFVCMIIKEKKWKGIKILSNDFDFEKILNQQYNIFELRNKEKSTSNFISFDLNNNIIINKKICYNEINENNNSLLILPPKNKMYILKTNKGKLILLVYKKNGEFYCKYMLFGNHNYNKKNDNIQEFDVFSDISTLSKYFYLNSNLLNFCRDINNEKYKNIFLEGKHGSGKTEILKRYLDGEKIFISAEGDNLYADPIVIIFDKVRQHLGIVKSAFVKLFCAFRLNIIPLLAPLSIFTVIVINNISDLLEKKINLNFCSVVIILVIIYFLISFLYYDIVIHVKNTTKINRNEFIRFLNIASKKFKLSIIIEDLDRIKEDEYWKMEIINLIKSLKTGRIIVSYTNRLNKEQVFDNEEIKKHFDIYVKYGNQIYLYCNQLYKKYHEPKLLHIDSFRELKYMLHVGSTEKNGNLYNPNYLLFQILTKEDKGLPDQVSKSEFLKYSVEQIMSTKNVEVEYDVIVFLSILFLEKYNKNMYWITGSNKKKFDERINELLLFIKKYYFDNKIGEIDEERFNEIFLNNLNQYAKGVGII